MLRRRRAVWDDTSWREMYDAADPSGIPVTARMVACYVDGYEWADRAHRLFPHASVVTIAVDAHDNADVLDIEPGAASIWQARGWLKRQIRRGLYRPTVYCSRYRKWPIRVLTAGIRKDWWIADWTGEPHTLRGAAAVQYASNPYFDVSLVADPGWPHRAHPLRPVRPPVPSPPPRPTPVPHHRVTHFLEDLVQLNHGKHAETVMAIPGGATGIRISASPSAVLLLDWGQSQVPVKHEVSFATGPLDLVLPRGPQGKTVRQVKFVRAESDPDGDVSVATI